jgi:outer membrane lipoprotein-sorting protein
MRHLSLSVLSLFLFASVGYRAQAQQPSAQQIVERMASVYASCRSYVDEGDVTTVFLEEKRRRTQVKPFSTAFVSPSNFRFEYRNRRGEDEWDAHIVWRDAESVKSWWSIRPGVESPRDLFTALGGAAGVSSGASVTIPTLLMPEGMLGSRIKSLSGLRLVGEEEVDGGRAYRLEGLDSGGNPLTVWVDEASMLLLKVYETRKFEKFETETTTTYRPQVNAAVAQEKLAFNPPADKGR